MPGLYAKYIIYDIEHGIFVDDCFVLRPARDPAALTALRAYALATTDGELYTDLIRWIGEIEEAAQQVTAPDAVSGGLVEIEGDDPEEVIGMEWEY